MTDIKRWLWYTLATRHFPQTAFELYKKINDIDEIYSFCESDLQALGITDDGFIDAICNKDMAYAERELFYCNMNHIKLYPIDDKNYPLFLKNIYDPPLLLYMRGNFFDWEDELYITVVGTRDSTEYGREMARIISRDLAAAGVTVISGMASGIDAAAHNGCMQAGGRTIAVLGCGVNRAYPPENRDLMVHIMNRGCLLSEYNLEYEFHKDAYPRRNRIMCGLSVGVVVIEAPNRSGAVISGNLALEEGRDLFVVPGNANSITSAGSNELLKTGAKIVTCAADILEEYTMLYPHLMKYRRFNTYSAEFEMVPYISGNKLMQTALRALETKPMPVAELARSCGVSVARANGLLSVLISLNSVALHGDLYFKTGASDTLSVGTIE